MSAVDLVVALCWASVLAVLVSLVLIAVVVVASALDRWQLTRLRRKLHDPHQ